MGVNYVFQSTMMNYDNNQEKAPGYTKEPVNKNRTISFSKYWRKIALVIGLCVIAILFTLPVVFYFISVSKVYLSVAP